MTSSVAGLAAAATPLLAPLGFAKRAGAVYTAALLDDVLGWLGLNTAREHHPAGVVEVNPVIGVRHQVVERMVAELRGSAFHPYQPPTVSCPIGYLMPQKKYTSWVVDTKAEQMKQRIEPMVNTVERYGLPFIRRAGELRTLCQLLDEGCGLDHQLVYRRPVAWMLAGNPHRAVMELEKAVRELNARTDPAAEQLRRFAEALRRRLAA